MAVDARGVIMKRSMLRVITSASSCARLCAMRNALNFVYRDHITWIGSAREPLNVQFGGLFVQKGSWRASEDAVKRVTAAAITSAPNTMEKKYGSSAESVGCWSRSPYRESTNCFVVLWIPPVLSRYEIVMRGKHPARFLQRVGRNIRRTDDSLMSHLPASGLLARSPRPASNRAPDRRSAPSAGPGRWQGLLWHW